MARKSGFSTSTVSIILSDAPLARHFSDKTRKHIHKTADAMGYRPHALARSLRRRRSHNIGIMTFDLSDPFCTLILRGIQKTLNPTSYLPILMDAQNQRSQFERYLEMLLEHQVEGLIVVANWLFEEFDVLADLERNRIPTVGVGRDLRASNIHSVQVDNEAGGYLAAQHLYELGHRKLAVIRGPQELADSERRWEGIQRFATEKRLALDRRLVVQLPAAEDPTSGFAGGVQQTRKLLASRLPFTAILAFDDMTALGAIRSLTEARVGVPGDCSVVGFDDVPIAALTSPSLTTIQQPMEQMGSLVAGWMLASMDPEQRSVVTRGKLDLLAPRLLVRDSTAAVPARPKRGKRPRS